MPVLLWNLQELICAVYLSNKRGIFQDLELLMWQWQDRSPCFSFDICRVLVFPIFHQFLDVISCMHYYWCSSTHLDLNLEHLQELIPAFFFIFVLQLKIRNDFDPVLSPESSLFVLKSNKQVGPRHFCLIKLRYLWYDFNIYRWCPIGNRWHIKIFWKFLILQSSVALFRILLMYILSFLEFLLMGNWPKVIVYGLEYVRADLHFW